MHVLTILQRVGDIEPITLNVLSTIWFRLKGKGGSAFARLTANLWKETPTIADYDETAKKKSTAYAAKLKGMVAFASEWGYGGQDGMSTVKDYQRIPTPAGGRSLSKTVTSKRSAAWRWRTASVCAPRPRRTRFTSRRSTAPQRTTRGTSRTRISKLIA